MSNFHARAAIRTAIAEAQQHLSPTYKTPRERAIQALTDASCYLGDMREFELAKKCRRLILKVEAIEDKQP